MEKQLWVVGNMLTVLGAAVMTFGIKGVGIAAAVFLLMPYERSS